MKHTLLRAVGGVAVAGALLMSGTAFAQTTTTQTGHGGWGGSAGHMPGVFGTVSAVNGSTLTINNKGFGPNATATTYTVDAGSASVTKNGSSSSLSSVGVGDMVMVMGTVSGTNITATSVRDGMVGRGRMGMGMGMKPGVFGTVASLSGTTLTVTSKVGPQGAAATTYTVDASNAKVTENGSSSSVSSIAVGDSVMVMGTVSGTNVTATSINDGMPQGGKLQGPSIQGNGEPVVGGNVTAIQGSTLSVATAKGNLTYAVDASNALIEKGNATSSIASIAVGDSVVVQGSVNGTSVIASSVIDQGAPNTSSAGSGIPGTGMKGFGGGFMGAIGGFFQHIFGFL